MHSLTVNGSVGKQASKSVCRLRRSGRRQRGAVTAGFGPGEMDLTKTDAILLGRGQRLLEAIRKARPPMILWIALPMSGSGAMTGLRQITTIMPRFATPKALRAVSITWCVAAHGIGGNGARVAFEPPPVFAITLRVIHLDFEWFGNPFGKSLIYIRDP